jgi:misacylated tRNA(Ala) deacylase
MQVDYMTPIYLEDSYLRELDARVLKNEGDYVVLDKTIFYPLGGGQPSDTGTIDGTRVKEVRKKGPETRHYVEKPLPSDAKDVHLVLDWEPRYARMRMHTAQHLLSAIVLDDYKASTAGNQIHEDRSRIDFNPWRPEGNEMQDVAKKFNKYVSDKLPVNTYVTTREKVMQEIDEARRNLFNRVPAFVKDIRVIEIQGVDKCPCAGTHVKNTSEIGELELLGTRSKGADTTRVEYALKK